MSSKNLVINEVINGLPLEMLLSGKPQLQVLYFDLNIVEDYFADPNYDVQFGVYSGSISYQDGRTLLGSFGLACRAGNRDRVVAVYLKYFLGLPPEHRQLWYTRLVDEKCHTQWEYEQEIVLHDSFGYDNFVRSFIDLAKRSRRCWQEKVNCS